uniref:Uncharacterized protein n=1 Tax=Arundo donax TaxID=35708 RepID=A0A0A9FMM9_ARUDO
MPSSPPASSSWASSDPSQLLSRSSGRWNCRAPLPPASAPSRPSPAACASACRRGGRFARGRAHEEAAGGCGGLGGRGSLDEWH